MMVYSKVNGPPSHFAISYTNLLPSPIPGHLQGAAGGEGERYGREACLFP